jgi:hypothetical protein
MRTTVEFEEDTARALDRLRNRTGMGVSEAVNHLVRRGLLVEDGLPGPSSFVQPTRRLGLRIDVSNVADAIDALEGSRTR